jgi:hypothetical protein
VLLKKIGLGKGKKPEKILYEFREEKLSGYGWDMKGDCGLGFREREEV